MLKKIVGFVFVTLILAPVAWAQVDLEEYGLPPELMARIDEVFDSRFPPALGEVTFDPESPAADEVFTVTAELAADAEKTDDTVIEAFFMFSMDDGATWNKVEMDEENPGHWSAEVDGQPAGTMIYYVHGIDTSGNTYMEMPCKVKQWPPDEDYYKTCNKEDKNLEDCLADVSPRDNYCMFSLTRDDEPIDDEDKIYDRSYDIWQSYAGQDDDKLYFDIVFDGKPKDGTASPMKINVYALAFWNPDKGEDAAGAADMLDKGAVLIDAPLATLTGGLLEPCTMGYLKGESFAQDTNAVTCQVEKNHLLLSVVKEYFEEQNPSKILRPIAVTANVINISPVEANAFDNGHFSNMNWGETRSIEIE